MLLWKLLGVGPVRSIIVLFIAAAFAATAAAQKPEYRPIWIDVFHKGLKSQAEADAMLAAVRAGNYNTVILQVRKSADAYYNGQFEPRNPAVQAGFDPLDYIIKQARSGPVNQRLEVHAWIVTYRVRLPGDNLYQSPAHVYTRHPEWLSQTSGGSKAGTGDHAGRYYLDPGVPAVIDYNLNAVRDIVSRYDVDGIVFDYIRYPESSGAGSVWGYNPIAIERFNRMYGRTGKPAPDDPQFGEFRRRQISDQVRKIYAHVRLWRPRVKVGAATIAWGSVERGFDRTDSYSKVFQDWPQLVRDGFLDLNMPMNYKREHIPSQAADHRSWAAFLGELSLQSGRFGVNVVDGEELNKLEGVLAQIRATRTMPGLAGISTYAYAQPRAGSGEAEPTPDMEFFSTIGREIFTQSAGIPDANWLSRPTEGMVKGIVTKKGQPVDGAIVRLGNRETHTDGTGFYAFARVAPGNHSLTAQDGAGNIGQRSTQVAAGQVAECAIGGQ